MRTGNLSALLVFGAFGALFYFANAPRRGGPSGGRLGADRQAVRAIRPRHRAGGLRDGAAAPRPCRARPGTGRTAQPGRDREDRSTACLRPRGGVGGHPAPGTRGRRCPRCRRPPGASVRVVRSRNCIRSWQRDRVFARTRSKASSVPISPCGAAVRESPGAACRESGARRVRGRTSGPDHSAAWLRGSAASVPTRQVSGSSTATSTAPRSAAALRSSDLGAPS